ncbi:WecB/TagA/CpsF family glycosyltransferase [Cerasicoccus frondis]|uniref:WecB/TagA/CpsF family glycosyltransferase n=1 Tax=Cerasicoccus frondis TaxID=490090 RepID=UPI00285283BB|nr:WecB/TagA/CpsF family glycosyltransferase [Cerasicoccus frondis]
MTRVLGINFFQGSPEEAAEQALRGGLTVAPSGPNLADMDSMPAYWRAVQAADLAILDSGFLVLCWRFFHGKKLSRLSGLRLLETILARQNTLADMPQLWVMPTQDSAQRTREFLSRCGLALTEEDFYIAPQYAVGEIQDEALRNKVETLRPALIMINVAGSKQEVLGHWLMTALNYRPSIICTGAAIAFKTGEQANIPRWGDRLFLGWLLRIIYKPRRYFGRYWRARRLWRLVRKYGDQPPELRA